ncbi:major facilitator superfamily domain-containing protein [Aspergillus pseudoustus]|uniref:Major facilitator superfamily domain-containing protein n=1 Tax=Aspergillus pseudoustus TaxID=1810923 RepID=A0ABR4KAY9_9EURO
MADNEKKSSELEQSSSEKGAVEQLHGQASFSADAEKKLVRKVDFMLLPIMLFAYMMAFLDKQALNYTSLMGLREDLGLVGSQYSWSSSIFYFGYLVFSPFASMLLVKFPLGKYLAMNFMIWSVVLACHAATKNFAGIMVTRFFLGVTEASISPGFSLITSLWYRSSEQPLRHGIWFCGNSLSLMFGNLIAVGIWQIDGGIKPWQWLFIIFGLVTFLWGILMLFRLPDSPANASFLTEEERAIALHRLASNKAGFKSDKINRGQIMEAFVDPKTYLLAIYILAANIPNGGFTTFSGLILQGFGYSTFHTLLLGIPGGFVVFLFVLSSSITASKVRNTRLIVSVVMTIISVIGTALVYSTSAIASRYIGLILMGAYSAALPVIMAMISSNIGGFTKRSTVNAIFFVMYCVGNIIGPQLFFESEAPRYQSGLQAILICLVVVVVDCIALLLYLRRENAKRDRMGLDIATEIPQGDGGLRDETDLNNPAFRYVY